MNKEDKSKSNDNDEGNPNQFLVEMRQQAVAAAFAERDESITVDLLITQCHALLRTNQEIWLRCKPFYCKMINAADSEISKCLFFRVGYTYVRGTRNYKDSFRIESEMELVKRSFEIPINLPARLQSLIIPPHPTENDIMPNYELLLQRSMLLIDDVLPGFLLEFKTLLEKQQVALGQVETWLLRANEFAYFLCSLFAVKLAPCDVYTWYRRHDLVSEEVFDRILEAETCFRCKREFCQHIDNEEDWVDCRGDRQPGCFSLYKSRRHLLEYSWKGTMEFEFCLEIPEQQSLLSSFVDFLHHNVEVMDTEES